MGARRGGPRHGRTGVGLGPGPVPPAGGAARHRRVQGRPPRRAARDCHRPRRRGPAAVAVAVAAPPGLSPGAHGGDAMIRRPRLRGPREPLAAAAAPVVLLVTFSPGALGFGGSHAAVAGHIAFAMAFGPIALLISALPAAAVSIAVARGGVVARPGGAG